MLNLPILILVVLTFQMISAFNTVTFSQRRIAKTLIQPTIFRSLTTSTEALTPKKTKKVKKVEDDSIIKPKKAVTSYLAFAKICFPEIKKQNPTFKVGDIATETGKKWSALSETEKEVYKKLAADDKKRYEEELAIYEKKIQSTK